MVPFVTLLACAGADGEAPAPLPQYPSPMIETARAHERVERRALAGETFEIPGVLAEPIVVYAPLATRDAGTFTLHLHFHGDPFVAAHAVDALEEPTVAAAVHLGAGSSAYRIPFEGGDRFQELLTVVEELGRERLGDKTVGRVTVSSFSAGYGAVRELLRRPRAVERIDGVLVLDGMHTDYVPERVTLAEGGAVSGEQMEPFVAFARAAARGEKTFVVTHSEIFPGTYSSTTETADYLLDALGLERTPVLAWGPGGMQQVSEASSGRFAVLGFAGNTGPDHIDHLHALGRMLERLGSHTK